MWYYRYSLIIFGGEKVVVYHGSSVLVIDPIILKSDRKLDFGEGFYTTFNKEQAVRWSERVADRDKTKTRIITEYNFDMTAAEKEISIIKFENPDVVWLDFVCANRLGRESAKNYDIAIGPVANDSVYQTILFYEQNVYDKDEAIKRLKIQELYNQVLFHTEKSLCYCQYIRHEIIEV